jgi:hypothetical protein
MVKEVKEVVKGEEGEVEEEDEGKKEEKEGQEHVRKDGHYELFVLSITAPRSVASVA